MCDVIGVRHSERETAQSVALLEADDYWADPYKLQSKWIFSKALPTSVGMICVILFHHSS